MFVKPGIDASERQAPATERRLIATSLAGVTAAVGWTALTIDFTRSVSASLAKGHSLIQALFLFFHFFTIITNVGTAILMTITALRLATRHPLPPARIFNAALIYILVTCVTYEIMLRSAWTPHGMQVVTDFIIHDVVPALVLVFWLFFAPRAHARWRDAVLMLAYPAAFFAMTLIAGALGEPYPYSFLDVDKLGYRRVFIVGVVFIAIFYGLGIVTTALSKAWSTRPKGDRSQVV